MSVWGTDGRPAAPKEGDFGFNATTEAFEVWDGYAWNTISPTDLTNYCTKSEAIAYAIAL